MAKTHTPTRAFDEVIERVEKQGECLAWQQVPRLVRGRYKEASQIQRAIRKTLKKLPPADPGYGYVFWNPKTKTVFAVLGDGDNEQQHQRWHNALKALPGVRSVESESEGHPPNVEDWVRIKAASDFSWLNAPYELAGKPFGGPSAMSNAIVSGLLGGGLGYGGGALAEHLLPERFVQRGRLRKNLAALGAAGGALLHAPQAVINAKMNRRATGEPRWTSSIFLGDQHQQVSPDEFSWRDHQNNVKAGHWEALERFSEKFPDLPDHLQQSAAEFVKLAFPGTGLTGQPGTPLRPVPVDAFNQAIWNDVHNGPRSSQSNPYGTRDPRGDNSDELRTPPAHAAAATGLVSGVQQMYGNASLLSPQHFMKGLATAGVDLATARLAGGILGALGGLKPEAQRKIQDMGLWGGMIRGVTGSVLGLK